MGDELSKILKDYANNEIVNKSLSAGLDNLSLTLTAIEEYRNCEIQRLEAKVSTYFVYYLTTIKTVNCILILGKLLAYDVLWLIIKIFVSGFT